MVISPKRLDTNFEFGRHAPLERPGTIPEKLFSKGGVAIGNIGATENARHENAAQGKMQVWKMQEWKIRHKTAGLENARLENVAQKCRT